MSTSEIEIIKLALNAGTLGLNVLIIVLLYLLVSRWAPQFIRALTDARAAFADLAARLDRSPPTKPDPPPPSRGKEPRK